MASAEAVECCSDIGGTIATRSAQRFIHGVFHRRRTQLRFRGCQSLFVDVNQMLRHLRSIDRLGTGIYTGEPFAPAAQRNFADSVAGAAERAGRIDRILRLPRFVALIGPEPGRIGPMISIELERIEALELLGMTLAHLNNAEVRGDLSPRVPLLMAVRDKLAIALREEP